MTFRSKSLLKCSELLSGLQDQENMTLSLLKEDDFHDGVFCTVVAHHINPKVWRPIYQTIVDRHNEDLTK